MVRQATETAVRASISTPVGPLVLTRAVTARPPEKRLPVSVFCLTMNLVNTLRSPTAVLTPPGLA